MPFPSMLAVTGDRVTARALLVADRIDTAGLERSDAFSTTPLSFPAGAKGVVTLFRFGVIAFVGLTTLEEDDVIRALSPRIKGELAGREEEVAIIELSEEREDQIPPGGPIYVKALTAERVLVISDALAKSTVLAHDEREVAFVFDKIEPFARELADNGQTPGGRRAMLRQIGISLLVQQRISGRAAVAEKPDVLWDRPDLERLYARLETEYELKERADVLNRKLAVVTETAQALTDVINTERSMRLELTIIALILIEVVLAAYQIFGFHAMR